MELFQKIADDMFYLDYYESSTLIIMNQFGYFLVTISLTRAKYSDRLLEKLHFFKLPKAGIKVKNLGIKCFE